MMIKSRINARENRFINILNGEELTIFVPGARQNLEKLLQEETPEVTVIPYESSQQVESHLPKCSKRPTLVLAPDGKLLAMEKLTEKFPQVRIIASSNVEINHPSVCISLATDGEVLELVRRLRNRNNEVDQRRMEQ